MLLRKSEFQRSLRRMEPPKTLNEELINALKGIERNTRFIVSLLAFLSLLIGLSAFAFVQRFDKILELFN